MRKALVAGCPVEDALRLLSGKWRLLILFRLLDGPARFNALQRSLAPVTQKVLTAALWGLEADSLVWRRVEATVPPLVTYGLTERARTLAPVFDALAAWRLAGPSTRKRLESLALSPSDAPPTARNGSLLPSGASSP